MGGNDVISGRGGNDRLLGEAGIDDLIGGDGDDALIGGFTVDNSGNEQDTMAGGAGNDRIYADRSGVNFSNGFYDGDLFFPDPGGLQDSIVDQQANDALLTFYSAQNGANWTDAEIQFFEETSFSWLQNVTGSSRILRDSLGNGLPLAFGRFAEGAMGGNILGAANVVFLTGNLTGNRYIVVNGLAGITLAEQSNFIVHEMAHNWDTAAETNAHSVLLNDRMNNFYGISQWQGATAATHTLSGDGSEFYLTASNFAPYDYFNNGIVRPYGQHNRFEDFATMWEYRFENRNAANSPLLDLEEKWNAIDDFFAALV